jgi:hypothetical protein
MSGRLMCITEIKVPVAILVGSGSGNKNKYAQNEIETTFLFLLHYQRFVITPFFILKFKNPI